MKRDIHNFDHNIRVNDRVMMAGWGLTRGTVIALCPKTNRVKVLWDRKAPTYWYNWIPLWEVERVNT